MPELGKKQPSKKTTPKKSDDASQVVSAYSEEGQARNKDLGHGFPKRYKVLLICLYVGPFIVAVVLFYLAVRFNWF